MNKEAIERTKERCWQELKPVITYDKSEMQLMLDRNQQLFNQVKNRNHMLEIYHAPELNIWEPLTPRQYLFVGLALLSIVALVIWWAK